MNADGGRIWADVPTPPPRKGLVGQKSLDPRVERAARASWQRYGTTPPHSRDIRKKGLIRVAPLL